MKKKVPKSFFVGCFVVVTVILFFWMTGPTAPLEEGKVYQLAKTEKILIDLGDGKIEAGRLFLFADRNEANKSLPIPFFDPNGVPLIRVNAEMEPGTIRLIRIEVPGRTIEGVTYPAYTFRRVEYNWSRIEEQKYIPTLKPRT